MLRANLGRALLAATLLTAATPSVASAEGRHWIVRARDVVVDVALVRPLGLLTLGLGAASFVIAGPADWATRSSVDSIDVCLEAPFRPVFLRPLGDL